MKLAPLTKLVLAFSLSIWAFPLKTALALGILLGLQILFTVLLGALKRSIPGFTGILFGVGFIFVIQYFFGGGMNAAIITSLKMLTMTVPFIMLVAATPIQDLSAACAGVCVFADFDFAIYSGFCRRRQGDSSGSGLPRIFSKEKSVPLYSILFSSSRAFSVGSC